MAEDVDEVEGVFRFATVGEGECLQDNERPRSAHRHDSRGAFACKRRAVECDVHALGEGEFESGRYDRAEVRFEVVDASTAHQAGCRWDEEVDLEATTVPALNSGVARVVLVGLEALGAKPFADLCIPLLVQDRERQPKVQIGRTGMQLLAGCSPRGVYQEGRNHAADDHQVAEMGTEGDCDGEARRPNQLGVFGGVAGAVSRLVSHRGPRAGRHRGFGQRLRERAPVNGADQGTPAAR